jgi:outer membrane protein assembly factor BamB
MLHEGVLVVASADGRVYGLDAESGKKLWQLATANANYASVAPSRDLAVIACTSGCLYAVTPATGEVAWTFVAEAGLRAAPAVDTEKLYLPTCGGTVHALAI